jgi:hypothetical protein
MLVKGMLVTGMLVTMTQPTETCHTSSICWAAWQQLIPDSNHTTTTTSHAQACCL